MSIQGSRDMTMWVRGNDPIALSVHSRDHQETRIRIRGGVEAHWLEH